MRRIIKMTAALMIVAALCATPLFTMEDSDAVRIVEGSTGLSFQIDSLSNTNTDKLFTTDEKELLGMLVLLEATGMSTEAGNWDLSELTVTDVKNYRDAMGTSATSDRIETVNGGGMECTVSFKATANSPATLFSDDDGTQELYKFIGSRTAPASSTLEIKGTLTVDFYNYSSTDYFKTKNKDVCVSHETAENTTAYAFTGDVTYTHTQAGNKIVRDYSVVASNSEVRKTVVNYDYGNIDKDDVNGDTEVFAVRTCESNLAEAKFNYTTNEKIEGGYDCIADLKSTIPPTYNVGKAKDYWIDEDQPLPEYHYYGADGNTCLFTNAHDASLKSDAAMESFLKGLPNTEVSDSYSAASSVASSGEISIDSSSNGIGSYLLFIVIGVLVVVAVAAVVIFLMMRKKKVE